MIPWVDGFDPQWLKQRSLYSSSINIAAYRDWEILRYWFRAVEKYAPWVKKIHFITCGQVPTWLNINHPKLHFVRHEDYIPHEWLPTFSPYPIELNMHRIDGLSEKFVYFNDDMFLNAPVKPEDFFVNGLPCAFAALNPGPADMGRGGVTCSTLIDTQIVAEHFDFVKRFKADFMKWLTPRYGIKRVIRTMLLLPFKQYTGFLEPHTANSYLKSTFIEVWEKERKYLEATSSHRFRTSSDVNQWLMEYWQIASGKFYPRSPKFSRGYPGCIESVLISAADDIKHHKHKIICMNDSDTSSQEEFLRLTQIIRDAYNEVLPEKSAFEL